MDRLKTLGTWVLLVIAFYIFSQIMIYLFLNKSNNEASNVPYNEVTNSATDEAANNAPLNRIEVLN